MISTADVVVVAFKAAPPPPRGFRAPVVRGLSRESRLPTHRFEIGQFAEELHPVPGTEPAVLRWLATAMHDLPAWRVDANHADVQLPDGTDRMGGTLGAHQRRQTERRAVGPLERL